MSSPPTVNGSAGPDGSDQLASYFEDQPASTVRPPGWAWPHQRDQVDGVVAPPPSPHPPPMEPADLGRIHRPSLTFGRAVDLSFEASVAALQSWWRDEARQGALWLGRSRLLGPPGHHRQIGLCRVQVDLGRGWLWPALPMELELSPWFQRFGTKLGLCPQRAVRPSRHYFDRGHALLEAIIAALARRAAAHVRPG